ncbi:MAG TPA: tandem-95 repeat protein, partial [Candidatus Latescibacteria bacterium]|nr:tandem-95 repeat protein [Candidatus Latescibacterota bacterium]
GSWTSQSNEDRIEIKLYGDPDFVGEVWFDGLYFGTQPPPNPPVVDGLPSPTNQTTLTVTGTKDANTSILKPNGELLVAVNPNTTWSASWPLVEGDNTIQVRSATQDGNVSGLSNARTVIRDTQAPDISSVSASNITATSATINWTTNESSDSKVDYGTTTSYGSTKSNSGMVTSHSIDLSGLSGHTTYHYRVRSTDAAGNEAASGDYTFTTLNRTPTADAQSVSTNEDTPLSITLSGSDPDGDPLTYIVVTNPSHGSLSGSGQTRTYTPSANYYGSDSFTFKVNDGIVDSDPDTVSITVNSVNDAPWIYPTIPDQSANEDYPIVIDLTGYEHDVEDSGTNLDWTVSGENPNLIASTSGENSSDDAITFTPIADSSGSDVVTLTLRDSGGRTASQEVTLTWNAVNDPPTLAEIPDQSTPEATEWSYNCSVWDPDGPSLSWSLANAPPGMSINSSGKISWSVPDLTSTTTYYNITVTVQDNGNPNESDSDPLNLTINADNDAPVIDGYSPSSSSPTSQCVYQLRGRVHQLHRCEPEHICRHRRRPDEDKQQFNRRYMGKLHFFQILDPLFRRWEQDSLRMGGVESG